MKGHSLAEKLIRRVYDCADKHYDSLMLALLH